MLSDALEILNKIFDASFEAYIVGGFPRDYYLNKDNSDIDITTSATPEDLKRIFKENMLPGENYGSVEIAYKNNIYEVTTFRKEIEYVNNRIPSKIEYIDSLKEDLQRRDFIMNTLCIDKDGNFVDYLDARADIDKKIIRTVGKAIDSLKEDSLRILRAIRFASILNFDMDEDVISAININKKLLKKLSFFRKKEELDKIFSSVNSKRGIDLIIELGIDKDLEIYNFNKIVNTTSAIGIWSQLKLSDKYIFSNVEKEQITTINKLIKKNCFDEYDLYNYGLYIILIVAEIRNLDKEQLVEKSMNLPIRNKSQIAIDGNDICNILGISPCNKVKTVLDDIEKQIVYGCLKNSKEELCEYIKKNYAND